MVPINRRGGGAAFAASNPFGYGAEAFDRGLGKPLMPLGFHTTHNMYCEILVAWGWQGMFFFFGFLFFTLRDCRRLHQQLWKTGIWPQPRESLEALGILIGLIAMLAAAVFLNRVRWELWWVFGGYVVCMKNIYAPMLARGSQAAQDAHPPLHANWTPLPQTSAMP